MTGLIRIVKGNEYPFKIYVESMGYMNGTTLRGTAVDLRTVDNLKVTAVHMYCRKELTPTVASDGSYLTVAIPPDCCMPLGNWGIRITGEINGLKVASAERAVFSLVKWNGQDYVPPTIIDGEGSYVLNMKFSAGDSEYTPVDPTIDCAGWIGYAVFDIVNNEPDYSQIDLDDLTYLDNIKVTRDWTNSLNRARFLVVTPYTGTLLFTSNGFPLELAMATHDGKRYYYTEQRLSVGDMTVEIR